MSSILTVHTTVPNSVIPPGYFDADNITFIQNKITRTLSEFKQDILIDVASIKRVMIRVLEEMIETVPKMNQRVIMYITNEFRVHQLDVTKKMNWEENYVVSQRLYDPVANSSHFDFGTKFEPRAGRISRPTNMNTVRFYST